MFTRNNSYNIVVTGDNQLYIYGVLFCECFIGTTTNIPYSP